MNVFLEKVVGVRLGGRPPNCGVARVLVSQRGEGGRLRFTLLDGPDAAHLEAGGVGGGAASVDADTAAMGGAR